MSMRGYRAFVMGPDGRIVDRIDLFCASEKDALDRARQLVDEHAIELWEAARRIERFEPRQ